MGWLKRVAKAAPVIALLLLIVTWRMGTQRWLTVHTGSENTPGSPPNYNFFSGSGSDLGEVTLVVAVVSFVLGAWHHVNCHESGCPRIGRHKVDGTPWCNRHHQAARDESGVR
jgi:hypothetical protein